MEELRLFISEYKVTIWIVFAVFVVVQLLIGWYRVKTDRVEGGWEFWKRLLLLDFWGAAFLILFEFGFELLVALL